VQIAATLAGELAAVGPFPVPGVRHDVHAFANSGLQGLLVGLDTAADTASIWSGRWSLAA